MYIQDFLALSALYIGFNFCLVAAGGLCLGTHVRDPKRLVKPTFLLGIANILLGVGNIFFAGLYFPEHLYAAFIPVSQFMIGFMSAAVAGKMLFRGDLPDD